jgi:hypothetical protein
MKRPWAILAIAVSLAAILFATLHSGGTTLPRGWSFELTSGRAALAELIQNLLLFIPLGASLVLAGCGPLTAMLIGAALSFSVEFAQLSIPGRDSSIGDIVSNTLSTAMGATLALTRNRWLFIPPRRARWQAAALGILAVGAWFVSGYLLTHPQIRTELTFEVLANRRYSVGEGWRLIYSPDAFYGLFKFINSVWLGGWMLGVGFWSGRGRSWWLGAAVILGLVVVPQVVHLKPTPLLEWIGAWAGYGLGYWLGWRTMAPERSDTLPHRVT